MPPPARSPGARLQEAARLRSRSSSSCFIATPAAKPVNAPLPPTMRWHGTRIGTGLAPHGPWLAQLRGDLPVRPCLAVGNGGQPVPDRLLERRSFEHDGHGELSQPALEVCEDLGLRGARELQRRPVPDLALLAARAEAHAGDPGVRGLDLDEPEWR